MRSHPSDQLSAYVDGELTLEEASEIAAHLAECAHCREVVSDLRTVPMLLCSLPEPSPAPSFLLRTRARLEATHARKPGLPRWLIAGAVAAAAAALLVLLPLSPPAGGARGRCRLAFPPSHPAHLGPPVERCDARLRGPAR